MLLTGESGIAAGAAPQRESVCGVWILHRAHANDAAALPLHSDMGAASLAFLAAMAQRRRGRFWWSSPQSAAAAVTGVGAFLSGSGSSGGRAGSSAAGNAAERGGGSALGVGKHIRARSRRLKLGYVMDDSNIERQSRRGSRTAHPPRRRTATFLRGRHQG